MRVSYATNDKHREWTPRKSMQETQISDCPIAEPRRKALLVLNPRSRLGGEADIEDGLAELKSANIFVERCESNSAAETVRLINQYHDSIDLVIIGGGDGTISSAAEVLYQLQLPLAVLPLGTANDFARSIGVGDDLAAAVQAIVENKRRRINLGVVNNHYFFNVAHIGLGVEVTRELTPEVKSRWGVFSYLAALIQAFQNNRHFRVYIQSGKIRHKMRSIHLAVGNGRYYGGGNIIDDQSTLFDGQLSLFSLKPLRWWQLLALAPSLRSGTQRLTERAFCLAGEKITVGTARPREIHADGEPVSTTPATFEVIKEAIEVIIGDNVDQIE